MSLQRAYSEPHFKVAYDGGHVGCCEFERARAELTSETVHESSRLMAPPYIVPPVLVAAQLVRAELTSETVHES